MRLTVFALTVQTVGERELNVTGLPEYPPTAATLYVPPTRADTGAVEVKVIV
jgi:hypothetical protein